MANSGSGINNTGAADQYADADDGWLTATSIERLGGVPSDLTDVFIVEEPVEISTDERELADTHMDVVSIHHRVCLSFQDDVLVDSLIEYRHYGICCNNG